MGIIKKIYYLFLLVLFVGSLLFLSTSLKKAEANIILLEKNLDEVLTKLQEMTTRPKASEVILSKPPQEDTRIGGGEVVLFQWPLSLEGNGTIKTSPFGERHSPFQEGIGFHTGLDIAGIWKSRVLAARDGVVIDHYPPPGVYNGKRYYGHPVYGGWIIVKHSGGWVTTYAHLSESYVRIGTKVKTGQVIGRQGNTGKSKGDHLHFEILKDGEYVNPILYLNDPLDMTN